MTHQGFHISELLFGALIACLVFIAQPGLDIATMGFLTGVAVVFFTVKDENWVMAGATVIVLATYHVVVAPVLPEPLGSWVAANWPSN